MRHARPNRSIRIAALVAALAAALAPAPARAASEADALYDRAQALCWNGHSPEALPIAERALEASRRAGDRTREAYSLVLVGDCLFAMGRQAESYDFFQSAVPLMHEAGDRFGEAMALKDSGIACRYVGRYDDGIANIFQAIELFRTLDRPNELVSTLANLGQAYANVGAVRFAFETYQEALTTQAALTCDQGLLIDLHIRLGWLFLDVDDPTTALEHFRAAEDMGRVHRMSAGARGWMIEGLSYTLEALGRMDEAVALREQFLEIARESRNETNIAGALGGLAAILDARDPDRAMRYRAEALDTLLRSSPNSAWQAYLDLGRAYRRRGDPDRAVDCYQRAVDRLEQVRGRLGSESFRSMFYVAHEHFYQELIETLVEREARAPGSGDDVRAFGVYELAKARAMVDAIAEARVDAEAALSPELRERQDRLSARIGELRDRLAESPATAAERQGWIEEMNQAEEELDVLVDEIKRENPQYAAIRYPAPLSLDATRAMLGPETALVAYSTTHDQVIGFVVASDAFAAVRLDVAPDVLDARVRNYVDLLSAGSGDEWRDTGRRLYADLVAPLRERFGPGVRRLVVVPDGVLHELPFETLPVADGPERPRYLVEDFTISYAPSATVLSELSDPDWAPETGDRADMLVVADPIAQPAGAETPAERLVRALYEDERLEIGPVPSTRVEAESIARYGRSGSIVYMGADASERNVKAAPLERFRVLHFATHGLISERAPYRSALVLAHEAGDGEDGFLQAREIYRLRLRTDLIVLSACQTARGRVIGGEGVESLARAFLHAGARSVIASLWNVNDDRTAALMGAFYGHLAAGESKADALRAAKLELLADPETAAPRVWAPFVLVGEAARPVPIGPPPSHARWWWILGAAALALLTAVAWRVRRPLHA